MNRVLLHYPHLIQDLSDLILQNTSSAVVVDEAKGLLLNYRSVATLPESLEQLVHGFKGGEPYVEVVQNESILNSLATPNHK